MTLADLKRHTLRHLELPADSDVVPALDLTEAVNTSVSAVWAECGGGAPEPLALDLVAGLPDYPLDRAAPLGRVTGVRVRDREGGEWRPLRYIPASSTAWSEARGEPCAWTLRLTGLRPGSAGFEGESISTVGYIGGPVLRLLPAPDADVTAGLVIEAASGIGDLEEDADTSPLPREVLDAACWLAAAELALDYFDDASIAAKAPALQRRAEAKVYAARRAVRRMGGGVRPIVPAYGFDAWSREDDYGDYGARRYPTLGTTEAAMPANDTRLIVTPDEGATALTVDISDQPANVSRASLAMAFSGSMGFLSPPTFSTDGRTLTVTLRDGFTFPAGDTVYLYYQGA